MDLDDNLEFCILVKSAAQYASCFDQSKYDSFVVEIVITTILLTLFPCNFKFQAIVYVIFSWKARVVFLQQDILLTN